MSKIFRSTSAKVISISEKKKVRPDGRSTNKALRPLSVKVDTTPFTPIRFKSEHLRSDVFRTKMKSLTL